MDSQPHDEALLPDDRSHSPRPETWARPVSRLSVSNISPDAINIDESFSFMTPAGHMFAALITFSAYEEAAATVAQVQALLRGNDPLYELGLRLGIIHRAEDDFWQSTLRNLAAYFGVEGVVVQNVTCVDSHVQWSEAKNVWQNAAMSTAAYLVTTPFRRIQGRSH